MYVLRGCKWLIGRDIHNVLHLGPYNTYLNSNYYLAIVMNR